MQHQLKNRTGWRVLQATDRAAGLTRQGWSFSLELKLDWKRIRCAKCTFMSWRLVHKPTPTVKHHHLYWGSWSRSRQWCETIIDKETWCHLEHPKHRQKKVTREVSWSPVRKWCQVEDRPPYTGPRVSMWRTPAPSRVHALWQFLSQRWSHSKYFPIKPGWHRIRLSTCLRTDSSYWFGVLSD